MKAACSSCGTPYTIPSVQSDESDVRIHCKKCGDVFDIRGPQNDNKARTPRGKWYYATGGDPLGPYTEGELLEKYQSGEIDEHSYVWTKGFEDWIPANDHSPFATAIAYAVHAQYDSPAPSTRGSYKTPVEDLDAVPEDPLYQTQVTGEYPSDTTVEYQLEDRIAADNALGVDALDPTSMPFDSDMFHDTSAANATEESSSNEKTTEENEEVQALSADSPRDKNKHSDDTSRASSSTLPPPDGKQTNDTTEKQRETTDNGSSAAPRSTTPRSRPVTRSNLTVPPPPRRDLDPPPSPADDGPPSTLSLAERLRQIRDAPENTQSKGTQPKRTAASAEQAGKKRTPARTTPPKPVTPPPSKNTASRPASLPARSKTSALPPRASTTEAPTKTPDRSERAASQKHSKTSSSSTRTAPPRRSRTVRMMGLDTSPNAPENAASVSKTTAAKDAPAADKPPAKTDAPTRNKGATVGMLVGDPLPEDGPARKKGATVGMLVGDLPPKDDPISPTSPAPDKQRASGVFIPLKTTQAPDAASNTPPADAKTRKAPSTASVDQREQKPSKASTTHAEKSPPADDATHAEKTAAQPGRTAHATISTPPPAATPLAADISTAGTPTVETSSATAKTSPSQTDETSARRRIGIVLFIGVLGVIAIIGWKVLSGNKEAAETQPTTPLEAPVAEEEAAPEPPWIDGAYTEASGALANARIAAETGALTAGTELLEQRAIARDNASETLFSARNDALERAEETAKRREAAARRRRAAPKPKPKAPKDNAASRSNASRSLKVPINTANQNQNRNQNQNQNTPVPRNNNNSN